MWPFKKKSIKHKPAPDKEEKEEQNYTPEEEEEVKKRLKDLGYM
jgi:hypothetical protein